MKKLLYCLSAALVCGLASCDDADSGTNLPSRLPASVAIADVKPSKTSVTFKIVPEHAASCAYACTGQGETPDEGDFTVVPSGESRSVTVQGLASGAAYTLSAWAGDETGTRCPTVTAKFETLRLPALSVRTITPSQTGATVQIATADAERVFWACFPADGEEPAAYTEAAAEAEMIVAVEGLQPETGYIFRAYAADADSEGEPVSEAFTTEGRPSIDLSAAGTANCYLVTEAGRYSFRADVRGNGISSNLDAASKRFDGKITVGEGASADWLWASAEGLVGDVKLDKVSSRISFEAAAAKGNAVIALFEGGEVVWSWHIWMTDDPAAKFVAGSDAQYRFLDRNVGATSTGVDDPASFGFFYQWGRKDPFIASSAVNNPEGSALPEGEAFRTVLEGACTVNPAHADRGWKTVANNDPAIPAGESVAYASAHPMTFITYASQVGSSGVGAWVNDENVQYAELWGYDFQGKTNRKTMFDPCPPGYKVPAWYAEVAADASKETMVVVGENQSRSYHDGYWPAQGYRMNTGRLSNIGRYGYYWSACAFNHNYPAQNFKGYMLYWYSRLVSTNNMQDESIGGNIRCIGE